VTEEDSSKREAPESRSSDRGLVARVLKALAVLFDVHLEIAQREAKSDLSRMVTGTVLLVFAIVMLGFAFAMLHVAAVIWVHDARALPWMHAVLAVAGGDAVLALFCYVVGRARMKKPILKETRGLVRKTVSALTD
jgi:hypothetical protein